jgi:hypothetical protein
MAPVVNPISAIQIFIGRLMTKCALLPPPQSRASFPHKIGSKIGSNPPSAHRYPPAEGSIPMKFAFPDEGAFKRFGKPLQTHCPTLYRDGNVVICGKVSCCAIIAFRTGFSFCCAVLLPP